VTGEPYEGRPSTVAAQIRRARSADAAELARLSAELGYRVSADEMSSRLAALLGDDRHHVAVAGAERALLGWIHIERRTSLERGDRAEIIGLVVDGRVRRGGWGRKLVLEGERWAKTHGLGVIAVRSNVARAGAHPFYESLGYSRGKTQHVYEKALAPVTSGA
jgi:GNAT superfamily N-acetyltransferase